jgi:hypothetical protein
VYICYKQYSLPPCREYFTPPANEKFGVIFKPTLHPVRAASGGIVTVVVVLPVRVLRESVRNLASEIYRASLKPTCSRPSLSLWGLRGFVEFGEDASLGFPLGEPLRRLCAFLLGLRTGSV